MIVSFLILHIGLDLLMESIDKIIHPQLPEKSWLAVWVLLGSILFKLWLALFNNRIGKRINSAVMKATAQDSLSDVFSTTGVLVATLLLLLFPNLTINLDAYMGVIVAVLILVAGLKILNETKNSILGEAPDDEIVEMINNTVAKYEGAIGIHDLIVHNYGPGHVIAALHIEVDGKVDIFVSHDMIDNIERDLRKNCGIEATIHMDPVVTDDERVNHLKPLVQAAVAEIDPSLRIHDFRFVEGATHTNLIFDVAVPFEIKVSDAEIKRQIADKISRIDPTYFTVVTVDRS
jgi:cation diffusion facilitator family transporter